MMNDGIKSRLLACLVIVIMICATMVIIGKTVNVHQMPIAGVRMVLPDQILGWRGVPAKVSQIEREILGEDTEFARKFYVSPDGKEGFFLSIVLSGKDRTSIHPPEMCLRGQGWLLHTATVIPVRISEPRPYTLQVMKLDGSPQNGETSGGKSKKKLLYLYWFVGEDLTTPSKTEMTFRESWDRIVFGKSHRWAYVTLAAVADPSREEETIRLMKIFLESAVPKFQLVMPQN